MRHNYIIYPPQCHRYPSNNSGSLYIIPSYLIVRHVNVFCHNLVSQILNILSLIMCVYEVLLFFPYFITLQAIINSPGPLRVLGLSRFEKKNFSNIIYCFIKSNL